jgi:hypothetical protein
MGLYLGNISDLMGRAFSKLRNGRRRPVLLEVPSDLSWEQVENSKLEYEPVRTHTIQGMWRKRFACCFKQRDLSFTLARSSVGRCVEGARGTSVACTGSRNE